MTRLGPLTVLAALAGILPAPLSAEGQFFDFARVVRAEPIRVERSRPATERRCTSVPALPAGNVRRHDPGLGLAESLRREAAARPTERCRAVPVAVPYEEVVGWRVTWRYGGRTGMVRTDEHPGEHLRVRVDLAPRPGAARHAGR